MFKRNMGCICAVFTMSGCANHPLTDDTTRYSTVQIISKVVCEAYPSLMKHKVVNNLEELQEKFNRKVKRIEYRIGKLKKEEDNNKEDLRVYKKAKTDYDVNSENYQRLFRIKNYLDEFLNKTENRGEELFRDIYENTNASQVVTLKEELISIDKQRLAGAGRRRKVEQSMLELENIISQIQTEVDGIVKRIEIYNNEEKSIIKERMKINENYIKVCWILKIQL